MKPNTTLYTLYGLDKPIELGGTEYQIGHIRLVDRIIISPWANRNLFFRHGRVEEVLEAHPEWRPFVGRQLGTCPIKDLAAASLYPSTRALKKLVQTIKPWGPSLERSDLDNNIMLLKKVWNVIRPSVIRE